MYLLRVTVLIILVNDEPLCYRIDYLHVMLAVDDRAVSIADSMRSRTEVDEPGICRLIGRGCGGGGASTGAVLLKL